MEVVLYGERSRYMRSILDLEKRIAKTDFK